MNRAAPSRQRFLATLFMDWRPERNRM